jgi:hypothetical protein
LSKELRDRSAVWLLVGLTLVALLGACGGPSTCKCKTCDLEWWPQVVVGMLDKSDGGVDAGAEIQMVLPNGNKTKSSGFCRCYSGVPEVTSCSGAYSIGPDTGSVVLQAVSTQGEVLTERSVSLPDGKTCGKNTTYVGVSVDSAGSVHFEEPVLFNACR